MPTHELSRYRFWGLAALWDPWYRRELPSIRPHGALEPTTMRISISTPGSSSTMPSVIPWLAFYSVLPQVVQEQGLPPAWYACNMRIGANSEVSQDSLAAARVRH